MPHRSSRRAYAIMMHMSAVSNLVSVEEYLHNTYHPDCDYVDGVDLERNVGEKEHGKAQQEVLVYFRERRRQWGTFAIQEQRIQVSPTRYQRTGCLRRARPGTRRADFHEAAVSLH